MNKPRLVAIVDQLSQESFLALPGAEHFDVRATLEADLNWLKRELREADFYWSSLRVPFTAELVGMAPRLRAVLTNSTGTDHLDLPALEARGIELITLKNDLEFLRNITPTAELAFGLILACSRRFPECIEASRQGFWARHQLGGNQLAGKTLGIIGVGRLGTIVSEYAKAFRMGILGCDPRNQEMPTGVTRKDLPALLAESDIITLHVHLTEETRNMINADAFARMKRGMIIVNTSRGGLIDEGELIRAMECGVVKSAGLDVIDGEWLENKYDHPLIAYSRRNARLLITPHTGGTCPEVGRLSCEHSMKKLADKYPAID